MFLQKMQLKFFVYLVLTMFAVLSLGSAVASDHAVLSKQPVLIRVCLANGISTAHFRVHHGTYQIIDAASGLPVARAQSGVKWSVIKEGPNLRLAVEGRVQKGVYDGPMVIQPVDLQRTHTVSFQNNKYRGSLYIYNQTSGLVVTNVLDVEQYLYGVVGKEMGTYAHPEALKAQAVVSRTYALSQRGTHPLWDVGVDTMTQVYGGYDAELLPGAEKVNEAVDATRGQVIYYDGQLIQAFFHANSGGHTENSENVWSEPLPYLVGVSSSYDEYAVQYPVQNSGWPANTYSWRVDYSRQELEQQLEMWNKQAREKGNTEGIIDVGKILDLKAYRWQRDQANGETVSGRVTELSIIGSSGVKTFYRDTIRRVLNLRSTLFETYLDSQVTVLNGAGEKSVISEGTSLVSISSDGIMPVNEGLTDYHIVGNGTVRNVPKLFQQVSFIGRGFGHGLGMSQWGARGMANQGYKYTQIIEHYYNQDRYDGRLVIGLYSEEISQ